MTAQPRFGRLLTAMVTPFDKDLNLDVKRAGELGNYLLDQGTDALVVCGTTGESPTVFYDQKLELFRAVKDACGSRAPIIANAGDNCTDDSIAFAKQAEKVGVDALMCVVPYYNRPPQEGLYRHFRSIAEAVDIPIIVYNVPSRTSCNMEAETTLRLAHDVENIVAVKQAMPDLEQAKKIIDEAPAGFELLSGDDMLTYPMMKLGGTGVISVISHLAGPYMKLLVELTAAGELEKAEAVHKALVPLAEAAFMTSNPIMVKDGLAIAGFDVGTVRLPLIPPTQEQHDKMVKVMTECAEALKQFD